MTLKWNLDCQNVLLTLKRGKIITSEVVVIPTNDEINVLKGMVTCI